MRSAHILYRALTIPAEAIEGTDGVLIIAPVSDFIEHKALFSVGYLIVILWALQAGWHA